MFFKFKTIRKPKLKLGIVIILSFLIIVLILSELIDKYYLKFYQKSQKIDKSFFFNSLKPACDCRNEKIQIDYSNKRYNFDINGSLINKYYSIEEKDFDLLVITCNPYKVIRRGSGQKVIGYSVYGREPLYYRYLELIARTAKKYYPDWTIRFYHDETINKSIICELECLKNKDSYLDNVDFCNINEIPLANWNSNFIIQRFWRWFALGDEFVDVFLSRDSDFCIVEREQAAVLDWLNRNTIFHIMRGKYLN